MNLALVKGQTSHRAYIFIGDSSVTTGAGLTGLLFNTASLVASYVRPGAARVAISLVTQTVTGAYSSGGFVEVDATNMPGWYRLDVPNAALATGVNAVIVHLKGAADMRATKYEVQLTSFDLNLDGLSTAVKAAVNAEVVDALATDTYAEPAQGTPGATVSLSDKIGFLYKAWRNKVDQTATLYNLYNDDAATVDHKATVADDGTTFTKGEVTTGP